MYQKTYNRQSASHTQYNTAFDLSNPCSAQPATATSNSTGEGLSNTSSPASQATDPSDLVLTPVSELTRLPLGTGHSPHMCGQQQGPIPVSPTFEGIFGNADPSLPFQSAEATKSAAYPYDWHSTGLQQFTWYPTSNSEGHNMMTQGANVNSHFPRRMPSEIFGGSSFQFRPEIEPETTGISTGTPTASRSPEGSPGLPVHEEVVQMGDNIAGFLQFNNGEMPAPGDKPEGIAKAKVEEPYAKLIQRALMSAKGNKMALQEIYNWFRENTDKANNNGGKGWQNSIRHNLSMNAAFVKCERDLGPSCTDLKKSTVWELADWAVQNGVQSTTRYRKGNPSRRGGIHDRSNANIPTRALSVRRGGVNTTKNRSVDVRRSVLTRTANTGLLHRHLPPTMGPTNHQLLNYSYAPNPNPTMDHMNWMGLQNQAAVQQAPSHEFGGYTYNNSSQNDAIGGFSQAEHSQPLYPAPQISDTYGSELPSGAHVHNQEHFYDAILSNTPEQAVNYLTTWNPTSRGGPYA
ncbi:hypothetical protein F4803DRAFT_551630 [Xylaria telfairii]|nr:hypothetical protein F4803DRAFT_551630 [Xylaria telfairii]